MWLHTGEKPQLGPSAGEFKQSITHLSVMQHRWGLGWVPSDVWLLCLNSPGLRQSWGFPPVWCHIDVDLVGCHQMLTYILFINSPGPRQSMDLKHRMGPTQVHIDDRLGAIRCLTYILCLYNGAVIHFMGLLFFLFFCMLLLLLLYTYIYIIFFTGHASKAWGPSPQPAVWPS